MSVQAAFGLAVRANRPLPGLAAAGPDAFGAVDVSVAEAARADVACGEGPPVLAGGWERTWRLGDGGRLTRYDAPWPGDAWSMRVDARGSSIEVERTAGLPVDDLLALVRTIGLVTALQLRGVAVLHGCAVEVGGRAVIVLGASGAGKSTTAAAFVRSGCALLSDDVAVVGGTTVYPGAPRLHVEPETARAMGWEDLPRVFETEVMGDKRFVELEAGRAFCGEARDIAALYFLGPRAAVSAPTLAALPAREALSALGANLFRREALDRAQLARLLPPLARLASSVPVRRVVAPDDLARAGEVAEAIAADASSLRRPAPAG